MRVVFALVTVVGCALPAAADDEPASRAIDRAVAYLAVEVPKWHADNACYSCHNNGDAARALMLAAKLGVLKDRKPLADTIAFLQTPQRWDANGPEGPFKDKKLARIQFAAALTEGHASGLIADRRALAKAAALVAELQLADGSWETDAPGTIGSPVTYGKSLATAIASRTLAAADLARYRERTAKAEAWFESNPPKSILDAAATLWGLAESTTLAARTQQKRAFDLITRGESHGGGWGPFVNSPPEIFDTALVVIALATKPSPQSAPLIARGRGYLLAHQAADGTWPATTRPSGVDSYAQQISTTAWALQALLATRKVQER